MKFELSSTTVLASLEGFSAKVDEAVDLAKRYDSAVYFECEGTTVPVKPFDSRDRLIERWKIEHDFFGLPRRKRRQLYRAYLVEERSMEDAARKCGVSVKIARLYILHKGWKRPAQFWASRSLFRRMEEARLEEVGSKLRKQEER